MNVSNRPLSEEKGGKMDVHRGLVYMKYVLQKLCMRVICSQQRAVKIETLKNYMGDSTDE